ncbi:MAG: GIY-YIG nuclease family protein [Parcubacteria group bacterium]|jgi:hypothetical protein
MHPLRTPISIKESAAGIEIAGTIPPLDGWQRATVQQSETIPRAPGVYALYVKGSLVYIGESDNIRERLGGHKVRFDEALWLRVDGFQRLTIEKILIAHLMPQENKEMSRHDWRMKIKQEVMG